MMTAPDMGVALSLDLIANTMLDAEIYSAVLILLGALCLTVACLVSFIMALSQSKISPSIVWLGLLLLSTIGLFAAQGGYHQMNDAVVNAAPELRRTLTSRGFSQIFVGIYLSAFLASFGYLVFGFSTSLATALRPGPEATVDPRGAVSALIGAGGGVILAFLAMAMSTDLSELYDYSWFETTLAVLMALLMTAPVILASVRLSAKEEHQRRVIQLRAALGLGGFVGTVLFGLTVHALWTGEAFRVSAVAFPTLQQSMFTSGLKVASNLSPVGWCLGLIPLCAGLVSARVSRPTGTPLVRPLDMGLATMALLLATATGGYLRTETTLLFPAVCEIDPEAISELSDSELRRLREAVQGEVRSRMYR